MTREPEPWFDALRNREVIAPDADSLTRFAPYLLITAEEQDQIMAALDALAFYADDTKWTQPTSWGGRIHDDESAAIADSGSRARAALAWEANSQKETSR